MHNKAIFNTCVFFNWEVDAIIKSEQLKIKNSKPADAEGLCTQPWLLPSIQIISTGPSTFAVHIKMDISRTDWKYSTPFLRYITTPPKSTTAQRNKAYKPSNANLFFSALLFILCMSTPVLYFQAVYCSFQSKHHPDQNIPPCLLTLPSFSRHSEHRSSKDHDSTARHNLCFTDGKIKALMLRWVSPCYRSLSKHHISNPDTFPSFYSQ